MKRKHLILLIAVIAVPVAFVLSDEPFNSKSGIRIGTNPLSKVGFFGVVPTPKPIANSNAPVNATPLPTAAGTPSTANVTGAQTQINALTTLVNSMQSALAGEGLIATPTPSATASPTPTP